MKNILTIALAILFTVTSCTRDDLYVHYALKAAGENRKELKSVLKHYRTADKDPLKLKAAKYLIANMPGHYSYRDTAAIGSYYRQSLEILGTGPSPDWQRDTLRQISERDYPGLTRNVVSDVQIMTADYLIQNIDHAFTQWKTRPWAKHLTYEEFRDWLLPYKVTELQSFDDWREVLSSYYSDSISTVPANDFERNSIYGAIEIVRNEIHSKQSAIGLRVIWEGQAGIPLRSAETWTHMTYGSCMDYVTMGTAAFRSLGLPAAVDQVPSWGRNSEGHSWYAFLSDRGVETPTMNSLIVGAGMGFYPYERIPKVWRSSYALNRDRVKYRNTAKYVYPFDQYQHDVTDHYYRTSDIQVQICKDIKLKDKYVYIAMAVNQGGPQWRVLDFGRIKRGKACFSNMGRNMLYIALGYDGNGFVPISNPFILGKDGSMEYIHYDGQDAKTTSCDLKRKYYESWNVVDQRRKILGAKIQCSDRADFSNAVTLLTIDATFIPHLMPLAPLRSYRYWRYMSPAGSWGNISELSFHDASGNRIEGRGIANAEAGQDAIDRAFDGNLLSNFEINQPDGNWVGMDFGKPTVVSYASVSPRSDDNDVCPGNEYELFYFDGTQWRSLGYQVAESNMLHYDDIPLNALLWLRNYTRGNNERPFIMKENGEIEWW